MQLRVERLCGIDRLAATTAVLQRARLADPVREQWEAFDVQWWWRQPRPSDEIALPVWFDKEGPIAALGLTAWHDRWQADLHRHPGIGAADVWPALMDAVDSFAREQVEILVPSDDPEIVRLATDSGFRATDDVSGTSWLRRD